MYIYGDNGIKIPLPSGGGVEDVTINGTSIVDETTGVASIPIASDSNYGVIPKYNTNSFIIDVSGTFRLNPSDNLSISNRATQNIYAAITPNNLDFAVKAALTDGVGPAYTAAEQAAAKTRLGVTGDLFWVDQYSTPYEDIRAAITAGKHPVMWVNGGNYLAKLLCVYSSAVVLGYITDYTLMTYTLYAGTDSWYITGKEYETAAYRTDYITGKETSSYYYPTTKAVADYINDNKHKTAFYGLAQAAGDTTMATSSNPVGTYTDDARTAIQEMLGFKIVTQAQYDAIVGADSDGNIYFITED